MKNIVKSSLFIFSALLSMVALVGCGSNDPGLCVDGTNNHYLFFHEKEEFDEKEGHEAYFLCSKCNKTFDENKNYIEKVPTIKPKRKIILNSKFNGGSIDLLDTTVKQYLALEDEASQAEFLFNHQDYYSTEIKSVLFSWQRNECSNSLSLEIASDSAFTVKERIINNLTGNSTNVYNLKPGLHYYRLKDSNNNYSLADSFVISNNVSPIKSNVKNIRDIAGYETTTGDSLKYGYLYRCALPDVNDALTFYSDLGIKTEMDLRKSDEIGSFTGVMPGIINFVHPVATSAQYWPQYDYIFQSQYEDVTRYYFQDVFEILSDETKYPIVFHCTHGADRTGTLAYIINGLAGVPYEELVKDYELTSFFYSKRWRSDIIKDGNSYSFDPSGCMKTEDTGRFNLMHSQMMSKYGGDNVSLQKAIINFLTNYCSIGEQTLKDTLSIICNGTNYLSCFE